MGYWPVVKKVINDSDILLEIVDARMPGMSRNRELESKVKMYGKRYVLVFNKIDLVSQKELAELKERFGDAFFVSGIKNIGMRKLKEGLHIIGKRMGIDSPKIGIIGYPNVGKSAVINALTKRGRTKVSDVAGTTRGIQWVRAGELLILDSPGVVPSFDNEVKLGLLGAKNPERLKNPSKVAFEVIKIFLDENKEKLERFYEIKAEGDEYEILLEIGKKKGFLLKGGIVDENRTIYQIIRDWRAGKLRL